MRVFVKGQRERENNSLQRTAAIDVFVIIVGGVFPVFQLEKFLYFAPNVYVHKIDNICEHTDNFHSFCVYNMNILSCTYIRVHSRALTHTVDVT